MKIDKGVPIRLVLYSLALVYLMLDLFVFEGPLLRHFRQRDPASPEQIAAAKAKGVVARVYSQPILLTQVDRRLEEDLWKEGRLLEDLSPAERKLRRRAALEVLIDLHLLGRIKVHYNRDDYPVSEAEIDAAVARFASRFENARVLAQAMEHQGWSEKELRYRLAARLQQEKYLEALIDTGVTEEEARAWYEEHRAGLALPERVRARHVFLATLEREADQARAALEKVLAELQAGQTDFAQAAAKVSEDLRTKSAGRELGWMQAGRLPADFAVPVFDLPVGKPALVRTKIGWHLVEVMEKEPSRERSFEEAREEIVAALEARKRDEGLRLYRMQLREFEKAKIQIFEEVLER